MSTFSYLLLLGNLFFRVGIILAISKKAGDRLPSAPLEMKPMVSPTDLSPKLHWPSGPQGHNVCSPASWKHTRSAEFSLYIFTVSLSWLEESTKFISKKKERTVSTRSVVIRGYFAICTPATQEGNAKIHFTPIKLEAVLLKETLVWWRWNEKLIIIIMFGSMRLSAWKHKRDPASRGGNYPQTFHFLGGGSRKTHRSPKYTAHALPEERRQREELLKYGICGFVSLLVSAQCESPAASYVSGRRLWAQGNTAVDDEVPRLPLWETMPSYPQFKSDVQNSVMGLWLSFPELQLRLGSWVGRPSFKSSRPSSPEQLVLVVKNLSANPRDTRDAGSNPGSGRSPGKGNGNSLQYFCLENPMDRGAWWGYIQSIGVAESDTTEQLIHTHI